MGKLKDYTLMKHPIPRKTAAWRIYGKGMEHFGDEKQHTQLPIPEPGDDELLVRNDAVGLCFSDTKIIKFANDHPRIQGRDLKNDPVIPGHEVALTVIKAGKNRAGTYKRGSRYIIQADVFYKGKATSYGYVLPGGLTQYGIITKEVLDGDAGSYLIQIEKKETSYSEAALVEPWACVVASYRIGRRAGIKAGGKLLIIGGEKKERSFSFASLFQKVVPGSIVLFGVPEKTREILIKTASGIKAGITIEEGEGKGAWAEAIKKLGSQYSGGKGFDDIIILGDADDETLAAAGDSMCAGGILNYMAASSRPQVVSIDAGKIHYDRIFFIGSTKTDVQAPYETNLDSSLRGEAVLMLGAGGPMGQMHVQLALESEGAPKLLVATDIEKERLKTLKQKFSARAKEKNISFYVMNPKDYPSPDSFRDEVIARNGGRLYDYVVCLAAVPSVIEDAASYLGESAVLNIFAGVSKGTIVKLNVKDAAVKSVMYVGSSGSSLDDMIYTLKKVEKNELDTNGAVAGISGMNDVWNGLEAVKNGTFPGKIIVYPHIRSLSLTPLKELSKKYPKVAARLSPGGNWTREAEQALLDEALDFE